MRIRGYAPGTPCFAEVTSPLPGTAERFYGDLFGWTLSDGVFRLQGLPVAALRPLPPGVPPVWTTFVATSDTDTTADSVTGAGGRVVFGPAEATAGRLALFADREGAVFGVWQSRGFRGAQVMNEPGAPCWYELSSRDLDRARAFYGTVFGWAERPGESAPGNPYSEWISGEDTVGGLLPLDHRVPPGVPAHWTVCLMVEDCAAACARSIALGGAVVQEPMEIQAGYYGRVRDPHGAHFAVVELSDSWRTGLF